MTLGLKPNRKFPHLYAIVRYESDAGADRPIEYRITVKKVVVDGDHAAAEVKRLNELNKDKGSYYFSQITRLEDVLVEVESSSTSPGSMEREATMGS